MMRAVLIRHAATAGNIEKRYIGVTDESICSEGIAELCESYPEVKTVIGSQMKRCLETAKLIYPSHEPVVYDDMRECDFGSFEGKNYEELNGDPGYQKWIDSGGLTAFPGGEDPIAFRERSCSAFLQAAEKYDDAAFIVHGGTIMAVMERFAVPQRSFYDYNIRNGRGYICWFENGSITSYEMI